MIISFSINIKIYQVSHRKMSSNFPGTERKAMQYLGSRNSRRSCSCKEVAIASSACESCSRSSSARVTCRDVCAPATPASECPSAAFGCTVCTKMKCVTTGESTARVQGALGCVLCAWAEASSWEMMNSSSDFLVIPLALQMATINILFSQTK